MTTDEEARLSDGEGGSGAIREGSADGSVGLFGPAPEFDVVFASSRDVDEPVAAFLLAAEDLALLVYEDVEPLGAGEFGGVFVLGADDNALFLVGERADFFPPGGEVIAELFDELGVLIDDIAFLKRVECFGRGVCRGEEFSGWGSRERRVRGSPGHRSSRR